MVGWEGSRGGAAGEVRCTSLTGEFNSPELLKGSILKINFQNTPF